MIDTRVYGKGGSLTAGLPCCPALAAAAAQPVSRLTTVIQVIRPRSVNCGLQLGAPRGIGLCTAPHLVGTNTLRPRHVENVQPEKFRSVSTKDLRQIVVDRLMADISAQATISFCGAGGAMEDVVRDTLKGRR